MKKGIICFLIVVAIIVAGIVGLTLRGNNKNSEVEKRVETEIYENARIH